MNMDKEEDASETVLGIDLGTTSVKISVLDLRTGCTAFSGLPSTSIAHSAGVAVGEVPLVADRDGGAGFDEQDVKKIIKTLISCVEDIAKTSLGSLSIHKPCKIGVTGQMHGIVLWKSGLKLDDFRLADDGENSVAVYVSNLYTWQDGRCSPAFLSSLPTPDSHLKLATGHGCATLFWLQRHCPEIVAKFDRAGTIMDLVVYLLCELDQPIMSTQNAASWGYFKCVTGTWNKQILSEAGFPVHLLPRVDPPGSIAGKVKACRLLADGLITEGADVGVGLGDLPCAMLCFIESDQDMVINIGTSAQVVSTTISGFAPPPSDPSSPIEYFPYFRGTYLSVAASRTGGNILAHLVQTLQQWLQDLGMMPTSGTATGRDVLFETLIRQGLQCKDTTLEIDPILSGERHQPERRGEVRNIGFNNLSLGEIFRATCRGIAENLNRMSPVEDSKGKGATVRLVGCGSALTRNLVLQEELERAFGGFPIEYRTQGDVAAAKGAALAMCQL